VGANGERNRPSPVPASERSCERALEAYRRYETQMESKLRERAVEGTADTEIQTRIVRELWKLHFAHGRHAALENDASDKAGRETEGHDL